MFGCYHSRLFKKQLVTHEVQLKRPWLERSEMLSANWSQLIEWLIVIGQISLT